MVAGGRSGRSSGVAPADDHLLALVGRAPVHLERDLVGAQDLGRQPQPFADLAEEGEVPVGGGGVARERGVGDLGGAACRGALDERARARIVPRLRRSAGGADPSRTIITTTNAADRAAEAPLMVVECRGASRARQARSR